MTDRSQIYAALAYVTRLRRLQSNLSQEDVYTRAGLPKAVYRRLEDNERPFSGAQIVAIADALGTRGSILLGEAEKVLERGEIPKLPASKRAWRRTLGFD